jgi:Sporulation and spore germination
MKFKKYWIFPLIIATFVSGCASPVSNQNTSTPTPTATPSVASNEIVPTPTATSTPTSELTPTPTPTVSRLKEKSANLDVNQNKKAVAYNPNVAGKTTDVTLYTVNSQCELVSKTTSVSAEEPINAAVGKILEQRDNSDFNLSGYRVNVKDGIATVDLRIAPNSKRMPASLSSCEQTAIFGSLRKTLTSNSQWKIKDVRFTEKGKEIVL